MFSGTVRSNLDPFGDAGGDERIWGALAQVRTAPKHYAGCNKHSAGLGTKQGL